jgi:hypothetical protein
MSAIMNEDRTIAVTPTTRETSARIATKHPINTIIMTTLALE